MPFPRTAVISDIHGNLAGLLAVLRDAERQDCARIICLGDLVECGDDNEEVVRLIRDRGIACVQGNHDEHHALTLSPATSRFLAGLPDCLDEGDVHFTHISPRPRRNRRRRRIDNEIEAWNVFDECAYRVVFVGHVHVPLVFGERSVAAASAMSHPVVPGQAFALAPDDRYVICVGAVGYGRDGVRRPRYGIWDPSAATIEVRAVDGPVLPIG